MSNLAQFLQGGTAIGDTKWQGERGTYDTSYLGQVWVRSGIVAALSSTYTTAAQNSGLMIHGKPSASWPLGSTIAYSMAHNGSGTIVIASGHPSAVAISTNNGQTWSAATHNNTNPVVAVVWTGTQFVTFGNSASAITASTSSNATTWVAGTSGTVAGATVSTVRAAHDGTNGVAVVQSSSANSACTFTTGSVLTGVTLAAANTTQPQITVLPANGVNRWLIIDNSGVVNRSTTANGSTWASISGTGITNCYGLAAGAGVYFVVTSALNYATSATGAGSSWTTRSLPSSSSTLTDSLAFSTSLTGSNIMFDGSRFITSTPQQSSATRPQGLFGYSTDGINWSTRQLSFPTLASNEAWMPFSTGTNLIVCSTATSSNNQPYYSLNWVTSCDYVGQARAATWDAGASTPATLRIAYVRIQ